MKLLELSLINFRCYNKIENITFQDLTVFVGANDVGKTALSRALEILLTSEKVSTNEYHKSEQGEIAEKITIEGKFFSNNPTHDLKTYFDMQDGCVRIKKEISLQKNTCFVFKKRYFKEEFNSFESQKAPIQKELLASLSIEPASNADERNAQFKEAVKSNIIEYSYDWVEAKFLELEPYLPIFDRVSSYEYENPDLFIQKTLREYIKDAISEPDEMGNQQPIQEIKSIQDRIKIKLNEKLSEMEGMLKKVEPRLNAVSVEPSFEFSKGVTATNFMVKIGEQFRESAVLGEGVRKKIWMGLLEWQMNSQKNTIDRQIIRIYDEPDVNLDYHSERQFIASIIDAISNNNLFQAIILTHSIALIDFLPIKSIRMILQKNDTRQIDCFIDEENDIDFKDFLENINLNLGIKNSEIFFEKAFLLVEGATESDALPILYKKIYNRNLEFDGIKIVNLESCGAWGSVVKALLSNRYHRTLLFLDSDCQEESSSAKIIDRIKELNLNEDWYENNIIFIGKKEFEDAFNSNFIAEFLDFTYPQEDGLPWNISEIDQLKEESPKFSEDIIKRIQTKARRDTRISKGKPSYSRKLADFYTLQSELPAEIDKAFKKIRQLAGIE